MRYLQTISSLSILTGVWMFSCSPIIHNSKRESEQDILSLHHAQRLYHFNKDSLAFVQQIAADFISVNKGKITMPTQQELLSRYHGYFSAVEFIRWDDVNPPILRFSNDRSLAYAVVDKLVVLKYLNHDGQSTEETTHFAWTAIYRKQGRAWKIECVTSTEVPK